MHIQQHLAKWLALAVVSLLAVGCHDEQSSITGPDLLQPEAQLSTLSVPASCPVAQLYAGTSNPGMVYSYDGAGGWTAISGNLGFAVLDIIYFNGDLYAATRSPGKVWRYAGGTDWTLVATLDQQVADLEVWNNDLYAGTGRSYDAGKLYRYNMGTGLFDYLGSVPPYDESGTYHAWYGIRSMYPWSTTGDLHLGDIGYDVLGRWDGSSLINDAYMGGSCIYDFAEFNNRLYASAYAGRILWSSTGVGESWGNSYVFPYFHVWELEPFQGYLYAGTDGGKVSYLNASHTPTEVWSSGNPYYTAVTAMTTASNAYLYFGTGGEAGYYSRSTGTARVYSYDGSGAVQIFNADGGDTGSDHAGIQVLYQPLAMELAIDIKPYSDPNTINPKNKGVVPVAILGCAGFDVTSVDVTSLAFGPDGVMPAHDLTDPAVFFDHTHELVCDEFGMNCSWEILDVNDDGFMDLVSHYVQRETGLTSLHYEACISGQTLSGIPFQACDAVRVLGK